MEENTYNSLKFNFQIKYFDFNLKGNANQESIQKQGKGFIQIDSN